MINQDHPKFKQHVAYLVSSVDNVKGTTSWAMRTQDYDPDDLLGSDWITCSGCRKKVSVSKDCREMSTGYIKYLDTISFTPCCGSNVDERLCPMICIPCKRVALLITPHVNKGGFEYIAGRPYHLDSCSECDGSHGLKSMIIEQIVYNKLNGQRPAS